MEVRWTWGYCSSSSDSTSTPLAQLEARPKNAAELHKPLIEQAIDLKLVPTKKETIHKWTPGEVTGIVLVRRRSRVRRHGGSAERDDSLR